MKKQITLSLEQAERINAILREFKLTEMSIKSYSLWFSKPIYRDITTLSKEEIFKLFYILKYDELLTHTCVSLLDNSMIVEPVAKKFQVCIQPNQNHQYIQLV